MSLSPKLLAQILERQGLLNAAQVSQVVKEARQGSAEPNGYRAYEQHALGYEVVQRLQFPSPHDPTGVLGEVEIAKAVAADADLEFVRIDPLDLDADLIESRISDGRGLLAELEEEGTTAGIVSECLGIITGVGRSIGRARGLPGVLRVSTR